MRYHHKKVTVLGFGRTGCAIARYLCQQGAEVTVKDQKKEAALEKAIQSCSDLDLKYEWGPQAFDALSSDECLVVSPGIPLSLPALQQARELKITFTNEITIAAEQIREPMLTVTGTNGKTTTTSLLGAMLEADQKQVFVGGNIGKPLIHYLLEGEKADVLVVELSSFQLELIDHLIPRIAVFTNLEPDHLDRYKDFSAYVDAKKRLLQACRTESQIVLNQDSASLHEFHQIAEQSRGTLGQVYTFTKKPWHEMKPEALAVFQGASLDSKNKRMLIQLGKNSEIYDLNGFRLLGEHNKENLMAAALAASLYGVKPQSIQQVIQQFRSLPHRLEFVRKKDGVFFFNDSKATNVMSVQRSLMAFHANPIILIAGGQDKDSDFTPLVNLVKNRCKILILLGEAKEKINRTLGDYAETYLVGTFEEAILLAYQKSRNGDVVLLSPACASYDLFKDFEERGDYFKKLVFQL